MKHNGNVSVSYLMWMIRELILLAAGNHSVFIKVTKLLHLKDTIRKRTLTSCPTVPHFRTFSMTMPKCPVHLCSVGVLLYSDP
jgi:hypothetical protein